MQLTFVLIGIFGLVVLVFVSMRWGASSKAKNIAEKIAEERAKDARIASHPYQSNPFGRMRRKK